MASTDMPDATKTEETTSPPIWTYPTRFCRICREDVPATVTMYPPGLPPAFQRVMVEYKNEDEYGRLIKPCMCRGGMRYIHELCLRRCRTENNRAGSMWKCHECGYRFNFQKLAVQKYLGNKYSSGALTVLAMLIIMFILGFVADPIINLYVDPYDTITGHEPIWHEVRVQGPIARSASGWYYHFFKGLVSMSLVGFFKTILLNPFQWWNIRNGGLIGSRTTTSTTGRDRAVNVSWIVLVLGISSAFYFFYRWVQTIIQIALQRIGNNIVNTSLPDDDDDLKPPPGWKPTFPAAPEEVSPTTEDESSDADNEHPNEGLPEEMNSEGNVTPPNLETQTRQRSNAPRLAGSWLMVDEVYEDSSRTSALDNVHSQGWSFSGI